ncbi:MAG: hypothetical protein PF568_03380 [Deltaproteobacteria bacterium]|nr:hypothetical protein [Deltaproteobacteria bacterium]
MSLSLLQKQGRLCGCKKPQGQADISPPLTQGAMAVKYLKKAFKG